MEERFDELPPERQKKGRKRFYVTAASVVLGAVLLGGSIMYRQTTKQDRFHAKLEQTVQEFHEKQISIPPRDSLLPPKLFDISPASTQHIDHMRASTEGILLSEFDDDYVWLQNSLANEPITTEQELENAKSRFDTYLQNELRDIALYAIAGKLHEQALSDTSLTRRTKQNITTRAIRAAEFFASRQSNRLYTQVQGIISQMNMPLNLNQKISDLTDMYAERATILPSTPYGLQTKKVTAVARWRDFNPSSLDQWDPNKQFDRAASHSSSYVPLRWIPSDANELRQSGANIAGVVQTPYHELAVLIRGPCTLAQPPGFSYRLAGTGFGQIETPIWQEINLQLTPDTTYLDDQIPGWKSQDVQVQVGTAFVFNSTTTDYTTGDHMAVSQVIAGWEDNEEGHSYGNSQDEIDELSMVEQSLQFSGYNKHGPRGSPSQSFFSYPMDAEDEGMYTKIIGRFDQFVGTCIYHLEESKQ